MGVEIERKFLVKDDSWRSGSGVLYRQGYLSRHRERTVRVRIAGEKAYLTIKGLTTGATRKEYEYEIPIGDAEEMLDQLCEKPLIEKKRYQVCVAELVFEVDEFLGANQGLVVAEVELTHETQQIPVPDWLGTEVTGDPRYYNSNLSQHPFSEW